MNKISKRITLSVHFGIFIFIINLITTFITGVLMYLSFSIGILNEKNMRLFVFVTRVSTFLER